MELATLIIAVGCLTLGIGIGIIATEFLRVNKLIRQLIEMKKAGFLPVFDIDNEVELDPSRNIREY